MTVNELVARFQELQAEGKGDLPVIISGFYGTEPVTAANYTLLKYVDESTLEGVFLSPELNP